MALECHGYFASILVAEVLNYLYNRIGRKKQPGCSTKIFIVNNCIFFNPEYIFIIEIGIEVVGDLKDL